MSTDRKVFQSSYLHWGEYDPSTSTLTISFSTGATLRSTVRVPSAAWLGLKSATRPGQYFHDNIKPFWIPEKVDEGGAV